MGNRHHATQFYGFIILMFSVLATPLFTHALSPADFRHDIQSRIVGQVCERFAERLERLGRVIPAPAPCRATPTPEPTLSFSVEPSALEEGASAELLWTSAHATSCTASDGWSGVKSLSGAEEVSPEETTTYTLSCTGEGGEVEKSVIVTVTPEPDAPTVDINAEPLSILAGEASELSWSSTNATSCIASNAWAGDKDTSGVENVLPTVTSTYAISCTGPGGAANDSVTVTVTEPEAATLTLVKTVVNNNNGISTQDAFQAMIDGNNVAWGVATEVEPGAHTASETNLEGYAAGDWGGDCSADGSVTIAAGEDKTCTITNDDVEPEPDAPTLELSADRLMVNENSSSSATTTLSWDSTNADTCTASGASEWAGGKSLDGTETLTPTADVTYELDCTGAGGSVHKEVVIDFVPAEPEPDGALRITEVLYDLATSTPAQGEEPANEWVEIWNDTGLEVNLSAYTLADAGSEDTLPDVVLPDGAYAIITASSTTADFYTFPEGTVVVVIGGSIGNGLGNTGDAVTLLDAEGVVVDAVSWGTNVGAFDPSVPTVSVNTGNSIGRVNHETDTDSAADWQEQTPNPGA